MANMNTGAILSADALLLTEEFRDVDGLPRATDIAVNRPGEMYVRRGAEWHLVVKPELTFSALYKFAASFAAYNQRDINFRKPIVSGILPTQQRAIVITEPMCEPGTVIISMRSPNETVLSYEDLVSGGLFGSVSQDKDFIVKDQDEILRLYEIFLNYRKGVISGLPPEFDNFLPLVVANRLTTAIAGATGSGKTTLLNSLMRFIPKELRILSVEDVREARRGGNSAFLLFESDGVQDSDMSIGMLKNVILRMAPDIVMFPELRSGYVYDYLEILSNGHRGGMFTMHASSVPETWSVLYQRLSTSEAGRSTSETYRSALLRSCVDVVVVMKDRKVVDVELSLADRKNIVTNLRERIK